MAEETKNPEVELDTDGVNEERVDIPEAKEPDESFAQKEDVDLGYTDIKSEDNVTGEKTAKELLQETKNEPKEQPKQVESKDTDEEGLQEYSDKVQKESKKLTFQVREAEREKLLLNMQKVLKINMIVSMRSMRRQILTISNNTMLE